MILQSALEVEVLSPDETSSYLDSIGDIDTEEQEILEPEYSKLASHIISNFTINKDAKKTSGIEQEIFDSLRDYNGSYNADDLNKIKDEGGSSIYMNLTATKSRAAMSWIRDILLSANQDAFSVTPTPIATLPEDLEAQLQESFQKDFIAQKESMAPGQEGAPPPTTKQAQDTISSIKKDQRDIREAILEEINLEALEQMLVMDRKIKDDLKEGGWDQALSDFIEDFCIFPTAFMKGPVITKKDKLRWSEGMAVVSEEYVFVNKRVSPIDLYPSPTTSCTQKGNLIEHMRLSDDELSCLRGASGYNTEAIDEILEYGSASSNWLNTGIEEEKATEELKGSSVDADRGIYHALHFWGTAKVEDIEEWHLIPEGSAEIDPNKYYEIEAILVGSEVIKCKLNTDPLKRRPYYKASYQNIPGSFWGRSLPSLMRDIQRMCNACARALANNMGLSAGPQIELYIDRLADSGDIEDIKPLKIWQVTNDPTGSSGRAINFFQVPSIANELLGVYDKFEQKADDATGIPRYSYGNEKVGGAAQTASGLSMLLESATKSIKDAIRHIDSGLIIPRVEYQFYWNLIKNDIPYTGDINVIAHGSDTLTLKGAQQAKRQEFLQLTANQSDQDLMGPEGRAELIRELAKDLNLKANIVPSRLELRKKVEENKAMQAQQMQAQQEQEGQKTQTSLQATQMQIEGQMQMHRETQMMKEKALAIEQDKNTARANLEAQRIAQEGQALNMKANIEANRDETKKEINRTNNSVALLTKQPNINKG